MDIRREVCITQLAQTLLVEPVIVDDREAEILVRIAHNDTRWIVLIRVWVLGESCGGYEVP